jgi:aryl-alcohol dehydrogenase-like predicted oxidoreductase
MHWASPRCPLLVPYERDKIQSNYGGNGTKSLHISLEHSLKKLQTSYIDLFYLHWWDYSVSIPELMHSLNDIVVAGKVLYLGISDTPAWVVAKANQYARDNGLRQFVVYQGLWNASVRDVERDIIPMCRDEGMGLLPFGTLGQGRFQTEAVFKEREKNNLGRKLRPVKEHDKEVSKVLEEIANRKGTELSSVALAYTMHKVSYVFPLIGCRKLDHLKGNIDALEVSLSEDDIKEIDSAYVFDPGFPHTVLSGTLVSGDAPEGAQGPGDIWMTKLMGNFDWVEPTKPIKPIQSC